MLVILLVGQMHEMDTYSSGAKYCILPSFVYMTCSHAHYLFAYVVHYVRLKNIPFEISS